MQTGSVTDQVTFSQTIPVPTNPPPTFIPTMVWVEANAHLKNEIGAGGVVCIFTACIVGIGFVVLLLLFHRNRKMTQGIRKRAVQLKETANMQAEAVAQEEKDLDVAMKAHMHQQKKLQKLQQQQQQQPERRSDIQQPFVGVEQSPDDGDRMQLPKFSFTGVGSDDFSGSPQTASSLHVQVPVRDERGPSYSSPSVPQAAYQQQSFDPHFGLFQRSDSEDDRPLPASARQYYSYSPRSTSVQQQNYKQNEDARRSAVQSSAMTGRGRSPSSEASSSADENYFARTSSPLRNYNLLQRGNPPADAAPSLQGGQLRHFSDL